MRQLPEQIGLLCDRIDRDLEQWKLGLPHFNSPPPGEPLPNHPTADASFALRLMTIQAESGEMEPVGIAASVAGLVVALRTDNFSTLADQVEREFAAVIEAAKKIDSFYKSRRRPVWIEDYGMSLQTCELDGATLLNYVLPDCEEAIRRFSQTLSWMYMPIVQPLAGGGNETFGQGETRLPRKNDVKQSNSAGAQPSISSHKTSAELPTKVRTCTLVPFDEARRQAVLWLDHLEREVAGAQLGQEFPLTYEIESRIAALLVQLGLRQAPITRLSELVGADGLPIPDDAELPKGTALELRRWVTVEDPVIGIRSSRYHGLRGPRKDGQPGVEGTKGGADDDSFRANLLRALGRWRTYVEAMTPPTAETLALAVHNWREALQAAEGYRALLAAFQADAAKLGDAQADAQTGQAQAAYARLMDCMKRFDLPAQPRLETAGLPPGAYVHDDGRPRPFKTLLADALVRIDEDIYILKDCLAQAETSARRVSTDGIPLPVDGVPMPENEQELPHGQDNLTTPVDRQIEGLIADVDRWICPMPGISLLSGATPSDLTEQAEQAEISRNNAIRVAKSIAAVLVTGGAHAGAVLAIANSLEIRDYTKARLDWPAVKVSLQEIAIRLEVLRHNEVGTARIHDAEATGPAHPPTREGAQRPHKPKWSKPASKTEVATCLGVSVDYIDKYLKANPHAVQQVSRQRWKFDKNDRLFDRLP